MRIDGIGWLMKWWYYHPAIYRRGVNYVVFRFKIQRYPLTATPRRHRFSRCHWHDFYIYSCLPARCFMTPLPAARILSLLLFLYRLAHLYKFMHTFETQAAHDYKSESYYNVYVGTRLACARVLWLSPPLSVRTSLLQNVTEVPA